MNKPSAKIHKPKSLINVMNQSGTRGEVSSATINDHNTWSDEPSNTWSDEPLNIWG